MDYELSKIPKTEEKFTVIGDDGEPIDLSAEQVLDYIQKKEEEEKKNSTDLDRTNAKEWRYYDLIDTRWNSHCTHLA